MKKFLLLGLAGLIASPSAALANAYAYTQLDVTGVTFTITPAPTGTGTFALFSDTAATFQGVGSSASDTETIPGTADALQSQQGTVLSLVQNDFSQVLPATPGSRSDAIVTASTTDGTATSNAESHVLTGAANFANASSGNRTSLGLTLVTGTVVTVSIDFSRIFDLRTDQVGEVAVGTGTITATLTNVTTNQVVAFSITGFNPSASNSVSDGDDFQLTDGGTVLFTWSPVVTPGNYTLNVAERTTTDVRSAVTDVPAPAALGLFGLGLVALGAARRRS